MYKFEHIVKDRFDQEVMEITVNLPTQHCTATELVEHFTHFLQGCGFVRESILSAMSAQAEELD